MSIDRGMSNSGVLGRSKWGTGRLFRLERRIVDKSGTRNATSCVCIQLRCPLPG